MKAGRRAGYDPDHNLCRAGEHIIPVFKVFE
jgi:hypothetical protein